MEIWTATGMLILRNPKSQPEVGGTLEVQPSSCPRLRTCLSCLASQNQMATRGSCQLLRGLFNLLLGFTCHKISLKVIPVVFSACFVIGHSGHIDRPSISSLLPRRCGVLDGGGQLLAKGVTGRWRACSIDQKAPKGQFPGKAFARICTS